MCYVLQLSLYVSCRVTVEFVQALSSVLMDELANLSQPRMLSALRVL